MKRNEIKKMINTIFQGVIDDEWIDREEEALDMLDMMGYNAEASQELLQMWINGTL